MKFRTGRFLFEFEKNRNNKVTEYLFVYISKVRIPEMKDALCLGIVIMNFDFCLTFSI